MHPVFATCQGKGRGGDTLGTWTAQMVSCDAPALTALQCAANEAMLKWLKAPSLPRVFVLDLLDFVLSNTAPVFR